MRFDHIVLVNNFINRSKFANSSLNLTKESFDFSISLGMFDFSNDAFDPVLIKVLLERVMSMFPVANCNELSSVVCQDLACNFRFMARYHLSFLKIQPEFSEGLLGFFHNMSRKNDEDP